MKYEIKQLNEIDAVVINNVKTLSNNGDYFLGHPNYDKLLKWDMPEKTQHESKQVWIKKIIATIAPFKIEGLPMLELPNQEEDVKQLAEKWFLINNYNQDDLIHSHHIPNAITNKNLWITGYKAAQKQYSEEDMRKAFETGRNYQLTGENNFNELLQSLQNNQFPIAVELTEDLQIIKWYYK